MWSAVKVKVSVGGWGRGESRKKAFLLAESESRTGGVKHFRAMYYSAELPLTTAAHGHGRASLGLGTFYAGQWRSQGVGPKESEITLDKTGYRQ